MLFALLSGPPLLAYDLSIVWYKGHQLGEGWRGEGHPCPMDTFLVFIIFQRIQDLTFHVNHLPTLIFFEKYEKKNQNVVCFFCD